MSLIKVAALDLGSNSFLCLLCEANQNGVVRVHTDMVDIIRLGQGLGQENSHFHPEALLRAKNCLEKYKKEIDLFRPDKIVAFATAAARKAKNSEVLIKIGADLGIPIQIISGEKEAEITYCGAFWGDSNTHPKPRILIDIGGGSTEIIYGEGLNLKKRFSIPFGAVYLTEKFITQNPINSTEENLLNEYLVSEINKYFKDLIGLKDIEVYSVAGTPTTLAASLLGGFDEKKVNGYKLEIETLDDLIQKIKKSSTQDRIQKLFIPSGRADVIYAGAVLLSLILKTLKVNHTMVSTKGVRYGAVASLF